LPTIQWHQRSKRVICIDHASVSRHTRRRAFITLLGGATAAWPLAARAQQAAMPIVGLLSPLSAAAWVHIVGAFRGGMRDLGYLPKTDLGRWF
jgi:hypothetical protein